MKIATLFILLLPLLHLNVLAQGENNVWTFGVHLGLDFNAGGPAFYTDSSDTYEGAASVCDSSGKLLFYSDGRNVYDKNHDIMPNGSSVGSYWIRSTTQGVAIAKIIGFDSLYYLFTLESEMTPGDLYYSIVDMTKRSGLGDVIAKKKFLGTDMSEKMVIAGTGRDRWLITHHKSNTDFYAYYINVPLRIGTPVISRTGGTFADSSFKHGEMKVSADFKKLALGNLRRYYGFSKSRPLLEIYDFNESTGIVSNPQTLTDSFDVFGVEFSEDGQKLYAGLARDKTYGLFQWDLGLSSLALIRSSRVKIDTQYAWGMRRGPDHKIYIINSSFPTNFSRIHYPNLSGSSCLFEKDFLPSSFPSKTTCLGFGNRYETPDIRTEIDTFFYSLDTSFCEGENIALSVPGYKHYYWFDGDTAATKSVAAAGLYWLMSRTGNVVVFDTFKVFTTSFDTSFNTVFDISLCDTGAIDYVAPNGYREYLWSDGDTALRKHIVAPSVLFLKRRNAHCHIYIDSFKIKSIPRTTIASKQYISFCSGADTNVSARLMVDSFIWNDGSKVAIKKIKHGGKYWAINYAGCVRYIDTFEIEEVAGKVFPTISSVNFCSGVLKEISGQGNGQLEVEYRGCFQVHQFARLREILGEQHCRL